ncbi:MAG TPA: N-6 DNA methylase, partial [Bacteroidota bacterium]|nr:N-6 DNA methylase [Bacteroidota bacterium]
MTDKESVKNTIAALVEKYNRVATQKVINKYNEEMTKKDFILPLFKALGWNTEDSREVAAEEKISKGRADYSFRINGIPKFFLEAKALKENLDGWRIENGKKVTFSEQAINYAWHKGCTWAVLTDFESVRVYNAEIKAADTRQSLFKSIACQEYISRFDELWLLSKESFENGIIDKEAENWGKRSKKIPVGEQLLADFTKFRELLSKNITKLNQNCQLTEDELDEAIQRILDRLIFIRCCEDRGLEERKLWEAKNDLKILKRFRNVFKYYDEHYNSKIFANHLCDNLEIDNDVLQKIIEGLYYTADKSVAYDFSAIEADVLGNIYEQYLSYILKKTPKRAKLSQSHAHRKEQGIYYTPTYIVDYIVRNTLGELLKDESVDARKIRVLDPACGSGSFLIKAYDVLNEYWKKTENYNKLGIDYSGDGDNYSKNLEILQNNIFGVDIDKQAVEIAQLNLLLKIAERGKRLPLLQQNIKCGNSLIDDPTVAGDKAFRWEEEFPEVMREGGFDVVIGNPPYVGITKNNYFNNTYEWNTDLYLMFIEKCTKKLLKRGGKFGFITPRFWLVNKNCENMRKYLIDNCNITKIVETSPFINVNTECIITIIDNKTNNSDIEIFYDRNGQIEYSHKLSKTFIKSNSDYLINTNLTEAEIKILLKLNLNKINLGQISESKRGMEIGKNYLHTNYDIKSLVGNDVKKYTINWNNTYININNKEYKRLKYYFDNELIYLRRVSKNLVCTFSNEKFAFSKNLYGIKITNKNFNPYFITGLINSKLLNFYYKKSFTTKKEDLFPEIQKYLYEKLPICDIHSEDQSLISEKVKQMLNLNKRLNEFGNKFT